jgi:hypothetical protein
VYDYTPVRRFLETTSAVGAAVSRMDANSWMVVFNIFMLAVMSGLAVIVLSQAATSTYGRWSRTPYSFQNSSSNALGTTAARENLCNITHHSIDVRTYENGSRGGNFTLMSLLSLPKAVTSGSVGSASSMWGDWMRGIKVRQ